MKFLSLANRNFKEIYKDPVTIILGVAMPVGLLFLFSSLQKNIPIDTFNPQNLTPAIVIFGFSFLIMFVAVLLAKDRQNSFLTRLFTTPLKSVDFYMAYMLPFIPFAFFQIIICFIIGFILGGVFVNIVLGIFIFLLMMLICINIGIIMGSLLTVNQVSGVGSILITVISLFSGAWMDLKMVGGIFKIIGYVLPFAHSVDALKTILNGGSFSSIYTNIIWVFMYCVIAVLVAIYSFGTKIKIK